MQILFGLLYTYLLSYGLSIEIRLIDNLYHLNSENYDKFVEMHRNSVIFLTTSIDCHICEDAEKNISNLGAEYNIESSSTKIGIIKCQENSSLCKRVSSKKPPVLFIRIRNEHVYFNEMYSQKNIDDFIKRRINRSPSKYRPNTFDKEKLENDTRLLITAMIKGTASPNAIEIFNDLSKYELDDSFMICEDKKCLEYFPEGTDTIYLLNDKKKPFEIEKFTDFHHLVNDFFAFKNPFMLDFETEFRKRVLDEMTPTLIFITDKTEDDEDRLLYENIIQKFDNNMLACVIEINNLSTSGKKLYKELVDILDLENIDFPLITYVEPNLETLTLNQYRFNGPVETNKLREFINSLFNGGAVKYIKYEKNHPSFLKNLPVLNGLNFKTHVFVNNKESVVLVHRGIDKCETSRRYLDHITLLSKEDEFKNLFFAAINGLKNELPIYVDKLPAILVFTKNSWDYPIVFANPPTQLNKFTKLLKNRKKVVFDIKDDEDLNMFEDL